MAATETVALRAPVMALGWSGESPLRCIGRCAVSNCNCVVATRGGEQQGENDRSVTRSQMKRQRELGTVGVIGRACVGRAKSVGRAKLSGIQRVDWRNPPRPLDKRRWKETERSESQVQQAGRSVGDKTEFMPLRGRRAAPNEVRASVVAMKRGNSRGAKGTQEGGKMAVRNMDDKPTRVPARASLWWSQSSAAGTRRLNGIFGDRGRHASPPSRRPHQPESRMREIRPSGLEGGVTSQPSSLPLSRRGRIREIAESGSLAATLNYPRSKSFSEMHYEKRYRPEMTLRLIVH